MNIRIRMTNQETGKYGFVFNHINTSKDAIGIVRRLNDLNKEAAKFSGKAVKFFYTIVVR